MPNGSTSWARAPIHPSSPNFDAAYTDEYGKPTRPAPDEIAIRCPERCRRMTGSTARVTFIGPIRFVASCCSTCCGDISSKNPLNDTPALFTNTSMRPKRSTACVAADAASSTLVTSSRSARTRSSSPKAAATSSGRRAVPTTASPAASVARTIDAPIPRPAPVTNQTLISPPSPANQPDQRRPPDRRSAHASRRELPDHRGHQSRPASGCREQKTGRETSRTDASEPALDRSYTCTITNASPISGQHFTFWLMFTSW